MNELELSRQSQPEDIPELKLIQCQVLIYSSHARLHLAISNGIANVFSGVKTVSFYPGKHENEFIIRPYKLLAGDFSRRFVRLEKSSQPEFAYECVLPQELVNRKKPIANLKDDPKKTARFKFRFEASTSETGYDILVTME
ncbi:hypothetical protein KC851_02540 [Candidatus Kaiserbacteria bacterium]|nr:hypothetical protein [Candidatus Kaiserbacteria bacterium]